MFLCGPRLISVVFSRLLVRSFCTTCLLRWPSCCQISSTDTPTVSPFQAKSIINTFPLPTTCNEVLFRHHLRTPVLIQIPTSSKPFFPPKRNFPGQVFQQNCVTCNYVITNCIIICSKISSHVTSDCVIPVTSFSSLPSSWVVSVSIR